MYRLAKGMVLEAIAREAQFNIQDLGEVDWHYRIRLVNTVTVAAKLIQAGWAEIPLRMEDIQRANPDTIVVPQRTLMRNRRILVIGRDLNGRWLIEMYSRVPSEQVEGQDTSSGEDLI